MRPFILTRNINLMGIIFIFCSISNISFSQSTNSPLSDMEKYENSIINIIDQISNSSDNHEKNEWNKKLISAFQNVFSDQRSLSFSFDKLYAISDLKSVSENLRIITWELLNDHDVNTYYGIISYLFEDELYTFTLEDSSESIRNAEYSSLTHNRWFGALYYDIEEFSYKNERFIVLLGINRSADLKKQKVIEILNLGENVKFGKEMFVFPEQRIGLKRKIYEFSVDAEMSIWFEKDKNLILMDHLSPLKPMYEGKHEYYAPDLSFDALEFKKGKLHYIPDYDARMTKTKNDRFYEMELPKQKKIY